ncbi:MAG: UvrD-helicase domain-containing protein [Clostridiales Family XIII bacterium]|nr:UvrD-helicase domain-containing protein [Clostridiales Family XIII bacterium]
MKWNEEQRKAIESDSKRILVSAAAGSGKTAVLVARIERLILENGVPIKAMLIVTFTNAAAAEMRRKIVDSLTKRLGVRGISDSESAFLREQLTDVHSAQISTFHAFAIEVIRAYYFKTGLASNLRICDEAQRIIIRNEAADELFARRFSEDYDAFTDFLRRYAAEKNEERFREEMLFGIYDAARTGPDPFGRLGEMVEFLEKPAHDILADGVAAAVSAEATAEVAKALAFCRETRAVLEQAEAFAYIPLCVTDEDGLSSLLNIARDSDLQCFLNAVSDFKFVTFRVSDKEEREKYSAVEEDVKQLRGKAKRSLQSVRDRYCARTLDEYAAEINETAPYAKYLAGMIEEFHGIFTRAKRERGVMDFADAEHYALEILGDAEVADAYGKRFSHIFVDEYQDSNEIQEELIRRIGKDACVFRVGDVKQSIYKFRLAEPELFIRRYETYGREGNDERLRIDLSSNYRSKAAVIDAVNGTFARLMTPGTAGMAYDENAMLRAGLPPESESAVWPCGADLFVADVEMSDARSETESGVAELKQAEIEALAAVRIIEDMIHGGRDGAPREWLDPKEGKVRKLRLRDIVILMRGAKNRADVFQTVFAEKNLPAFTDTGLGYFDTVEIETFMNLLRVIDNRRRDVPLLSVMYSPVFGFSTEDMMDIRLASPRGAYCDALFACAESAGTPESKTGADILEPLREKILNMLAQLSEWREQAAFMPLDAFVWSLLKESGYYTFAGALPFGAQRQANLRGLADKALDFQNTHMKGLAGFIGYVEHIKKRVEISQVRMLGESEDVLRIMTVHKSKGLEFPVVIVAGLGRRFVTAPVGAVSLHKDIGLALRLVYPAEGLYKNTLLQNIIGHRRASEDVAEEIRILYVAFTRAIHRLVLLGSAKGGIAGLKRRGAAADGRSHLEFIAPLAKNAGFSVHELPAPSLAGLSLAGPARDDPRALFASAGDCDSDTALEVERRLGFVYPYEKAASVKSKYAATELAALLAGGKTTDRAGAAFRTDAPFAAAAPRFMSGERELSAADRGILVHRALEYLDFRAARDILERTGSLAEMLENMVASGIFTPEEAGAADMERVGNFIASDICRRAASSQELYKETPFVIRKEYNGEETLVQGVIDCWFVEDGEIVLLDYKSGSSGSRESAKSLTGHYRPQLDVYAEALESIRGARVSETYLFLLGEGLCLRV